MAITETRQTAWVDPATLLDHPKRNQYHSSGKSSGRYQMILATVRTDGIKAPIRVQQSTNFIIGGHLRKDASMELGLSTVPVVFLDVTDEEAEYLLIVDNLDRMEDEKDPIKIARQCQRLREQEPMRRGRPVEGAGNPSSQPIHERLNMSKTNFKRYLSLLRLIPQLQDLVSQLKIGLKAGAKLANMTPEQQKKVYESIQSRAENESNYRMTEQEASSFHDAFVDDTQSKVSENEEEFVFDNAGDDTFYTSFDEQDNPLLSKESQELSTTDDNTNFNTLRNQDIALAAQHKIREPKHSRILKLSQETEMDNEQAKIVNGRTDETAVEKMSSLLTIEDEKARRAFATKQATSSIRSFRLAVERAEIDLVSELTLLEPQDYAQVSSSLKEFSELLKRVQDKIQRISYHMEIQGGDEQVD